MMALSYEEKILDISEPGLDLEKYLQIRSGEDQALLHDEKVLWNMLQREKRVENIDYCCHIQTEIKPHMRKIVGDWMLEVCQDQQCQSQVFHLALHYMDLFLSRKKIKRSQFQLLAAVCLFLASKMCDSPPITAEQLLMYTDNSVWLKELLQWEMLVLTTLRWELSAVTPLSFLEQFEHLTSVKKACTDFRVVQQHADQLLAIMATEYQYLLIQPSLLAAAALTVASRGQCRGCSEDDRRSEQLVSELSELIRRPAKDIELVATSIEDLLDCYKELMNFRTKLQDEGSVMSYEELII
jgi:cyclin D2